MMGFIENAQFGDSINKGLRANIEAKKLKLINKMRF